MRYTMKPTQIVRYSGILVGTVLGLMLLEMGCAGPQVTAAEPEPEPMVIAMMKDRPMMKDR